MQQVSALFNQIYYSGNYYVESKLIIGDKDEAIDFQDPSDPSIGYKEDSLMSLKTTRRVFKNNVPEVGCCPCSEIYVDMKMPEATIPRTAMLIPYVRLISTEEIFFNISEWEAVNDTFVATFTNYSASFYEENFYDFSVAYIGEDSIEYSENITSVTRDGETFTFTSTAEPIPLLQGKIVFVRNNISEIYTTEDGSLCSEWIRKGVFYIDTRENTQNMDELDILSIHGYDAMMRGEVDYGEFFYEVDFTLGNWKKDGNNYKTTFTDSKISLYPSGLYDFTIEYIGSASVAFESHITSVTRNGNVFTFIADELPHSLVGKIVFRSAQNTLAFPAVDRDVIADIARKMRIDIDENTLALDGNGIPLGANEQPFFNHSYVVQYPSGYTMKETLGFIGSMYGGNFVMNDLGKLQFVALWGLPVETGLITNEVGLRLVFGEDGNETRILAREEVT